MMPKAALAAGLASLSLAACGGPTSDAPAVRERSEPEVTYASPPLPSPDTEGAFWTVGAEPGRLIYGIPGEPVLIALECLQPDGDLPALRITRLSPADEGAGALLALVGNGHIGRLEVDAIDISGRSVWQGSLPAIDDVWEPLIGPRGVSATVPGAGLVELNPSALPGEFVENCRSNQEG